MNETNWNPQDDGIEGLRRVLTEMEGTIEHMEHVLQAVIEVSQTLPKPQEAQDIAYLCLTIDTLKHEAQQIREALTKYEIV